MKGLITTIFALGLALLTFAQNEDYQLKLVNGEWTPTEKTIHTQVHQSTQQQPFYGIIQFYQTPDERIKETLKSKGIYLEDYLGARTYFTTINQDVQSINDGIIRSIGQLPLELKLTKSLSQPDNYPDHALSGSDLLVNTVVYHAAKPQEVERKLSGLGAEIKHYSPYSKTYRLQLPKNRLNELAGLSMVQYIEPIDEEGQPENYKARNTHRIGGLTQSFTGLSKHLDGKGINVMLQDDGVIGPHEDYRGRIGHQYITTNRGDHGDHVGGTIMGAGNLDPLAKGMAPGADLYVYGAALEGYPGFDSAYSHYNKHNIRITSTSYSNGVNAGYSALARELDIQTEQMDELLHVFSAGNSGTQNGGWYNVTGGHKVAKNVLAVANLNYLGELNNSSSRGPARDGRIKPEISAVGTRVWSTTDVDRYVFKTGTSMSCPGVSGTMAVLYQGYNEIHGSIPKAVLMKGIACNTADDLGNPGPDFLFGYGRINARKAFKVIQDGNFISGSVSNGASVNHRLTPPPNTKLIKIMLIWNDPRAAVNASTPLVNDLDLSVSDTTQQTLLPWVLDITSTNTLNNGATQGVDQINNIEQITVSNVFPGSYNVTVKGSNVAVGPQDYHLIYHYEQEGIELEYPVGGEALVPGERELIQWSSPDFTGSFALEYSTDSGRTWNPINGVPTGSDLRQFEWQVPNHLTGNAMIRVNRGSTSTTSGRFTISRLPVGVTLAKVCPDSMQVTWQGVSGATGYNVYMLGQKYMEIVGNSATTSAYVKGAFFHPYKKNYIAVDAINPNGTYSRRTIAVVKNPGIFGCPLAADLEAEDFVTGGESIYTCGNGTLQRPIEVTLKNNTTHTFSNVNMKMQVNNDPVITEVYNGVVGNQQTINYKFTQLAALSSGVNQIKVWFEDAADQNRFNDTLTSQIRVIQGNVTKSGCYLNDFEHETACATSNDCGATVCNLTDGWINATNGVEDEIDWRVNSGTTPTQTTGPSFDHTLQNGQGKYVYLEASGGCSNAEAQLISPCIDLAGANQPKLEFWYHMNGASMGSLSVDVFTNGKWTKDIITPISGNQGNIWKVQTVDLSTYLGSTIRIRFRGVTGTGFNSDIALDDIKFIDQPKADFAVSPIGPTGVPFVNKSSKATKWLWEFGDGDTSTAETPTHNYTQSGLYEIRLIVENNCGKDTIVKIVTIELVGIDQSAFERDLLVYPLPAKDQLNIEVKGNRWDMDYIELTDLKGAVILNKKVNAKSNVSLNVNDVAAGIYLLNINHRDGRITRKVSIE